MGEVVYIKRKVVCQVCDNRFDDEELMLGRCHGLKLMERPWTKEDYENERNENYIINNIIERANKLDW